MKKRIVHLAYAPLGPKHEAFHNAQEHYVRLSIGGVDSGKTYMALFEMLDQLICNPEGQGKTGLIVARTYTHTKNQLVPIIKKILSQSNPSSGKPLGYVEGREYRITYSPSITIALPNGSKVLFWSLEAGDSVKGLNVSYAYIDELTDMDEQSYNDTFDRTGREGVRGMLWATGNPKHKGHWVYKRFFEEFDQHLEVNIPGCKAWCQYLTTFDNPHTKEKQQAYEQTYGYSALERLRKIEGRFVNLEGLCFPSWDSDRHVFDRKTMPIGKSWLHYIGQDSGFRDATAIIRIAKDPDGRYWVYNEFYKRQSDLKDHADYIKHPNFPSENIIRVFADSSAAQNIHEYRNLGVTNIESFSKGPGSIVAGIALINQLLLDGRLFVSKDCINLIKEIETYEWSSRTTKDQPKPGYGDHAIDALRYVIMALNQTSKGVFLNSATSSLKSLSTIAPVKVDTRRIFAYGTDGKPIYLN